MCYHVFKDYGNSNYKRMAVECSSSNDSIIDLFTVSDSDNNYNSQLLNNSEIVFSEKA